MKKSTKLLRVLLAFVMVISVFAATMASAAAPYKPTYNDEVTEEDVVLLLQDVNTVLSAKVLNGSLIERLYKLLPGMTLYIANGYYGLTNADKVAFYTTGDGGRVTTDLNKERFADLANYSKDGVTIDPDVAETDEEGNAMTDENGNVIIKEEGTFTKFFKEHPIVCNTMEDFRKEILNFADTVFVGELRIFAMLDTLAQGSLRPIQDGFDMLCEGLGVDQGGKTAFKDAGSLETAEKRAAAVTMVKNIVNTLLPDLSNGVVGIMQNIVKKDKGAQVYAGVASMMHGLSIFADSSMIKMLAAETSNTINDIVDTFNSMPTIGEADNEADPQRLDIEGLVNFLIGTLLGADAPFRISFADREEGNGKAPKGLLGVSTQSEIMPVAAFRIQIQCRHMILDRVAEAKSHADVVKIVYDYLYDNLICYATTNTLLKSVITPIEEQSLLEGVLKMDIPKDVEDEILKALETDREPLAAHLITLVAEMDEVHHHPNLEFVQGTAATCMADGTVDYYHCPDCELNFATDDPYALDETALTSFVAPATGHQSLTKVEAKAATCTENGNVEYYVCDDCGLAFKTEAEAAENNAFDPTVKAAGHQYGEWKEENGKQVRTCSVCSATETKDAAASAPAPSNPSQSDKTIPQIPATGAVVTGFSAIFLPAAAAFVTMVVRSKKDRDE